MKVDITLFFETEESAKEAGFPDAVLVDDDVPSQGYMAIASYFCDGYEIDEDFEWEDDFLA